MLLLFPRKFFASLLSYGLISCGLGACAIHPLPENVTGVKTSQIVHRNRCEARAAVFKIEDWLMRHQRYAAAHALTNLGIALSYTLDMREMDSVNLNTNLEQAVTKGTFSINPNAADALTRENRRVFTIADNYKTLGQMRNCDAEPVGPNYQYPIVGTIGIDETVQTFLTMALHEDLNGVIQDDKLPNEATTYTAASPTMVETLMFTTNVSAGITPQVMLTPVLSTSRLKLNSASLPLAWSRNDMHEVIIGLGMPTVLTEDGHPRKLYSAVASAAGVASRARTPLLIDAVVPAETGPNSGVGIAMEAVNDQIVRFQALRSTVVLAP